MQLSRLKSAGLLSYFSDVFVSDEIGFEKLDSRFFSECLHRIHFRPEEVLMVGDSLLAEQDKKPNPPGLIPDYELRRLPELLTLLINKE